MQQVQEAFPELDQAPSRCTTKACCAGWDCRKVPRPHPAPGLWGAEQTWWDCRKVPRSHPAPRPWGAEQTLSDVDVRGIKAMEAGSKCHYDNHLCPRAAHRPCCLQGIFLTQGLNLYWHRAEAGGKVRSWAWGSGRRRREGWRPNLPEAAPGGE